MSFYLLLRGVLPKLLPNHRQVPVSIPACPGQVSLAPRQQLLWLPQVHLNFKLNERKKSRKKYFYLQATKDYRDVAGGTQRWSVIQEGPYAFFLAERNLGFTLHLYHIIELELQTSSEPHSNRAEKYKWVGKRGGKGINGEDGLCITAHKGNICCL